jgi:hypothetical protein
LIYTVGGCYRSLYEDGSDNVVRTNFGGGELRLRINGVLVAYRRINISSGGSTAFRTCTPDASPDAYEPVNAAGRVDDVAAISIIPGKYLSCKCSNRSLISGLNVPSRPTSGFDILQQMWHGYGSLPSKLQLFGLTNAVVGDAPIPRSQNTNSGGGGQSGTANDSLSAPDAALDTTAPIGD